MRWILGTIRLALFFMQTFVWLVYLLILNSLGKLNDTNRLDYRKRWARGMARIVGFRFTVEGDVPDQGPYLFVGNHRSSLDPLLAFYSIKAWPVSRLWVKNWPLVGKGSQLTGIIFVDKDDRNSREAAKHRILEELEQGNSILIFPEGHTHLEPYTKTFLKGSFEQAAKGGYYVVPFVLEYKDTNDYWDRDLSFVRHFIWSFGKPVHHVYLSIGQPLRSDNPWTLLRSSQAWIDAKMAEVHRQWGNTQYDDVQVPNRLLPNPVNQRDSF